MSSFGEFHTKTIIADRRRHFVLSAAIQRSDVYATHTKAYQLILSTIKHRDNTFIYNFIHHHVIMEIT